MNAYSAHALACKGLLLFALAGLLFGCGVEPSGPSIQVDKRYLEDVASMKLWVMPTTLKNKKAVTCLAFLERKFTFDPSNFDVEKEVDIQTPELKMNTRNLDNLKVGDKIFMAAGYAKDAKPTEPQVFGCTQTKVEAGKRVAVSLVLIPFTK